MALPYATENQLKLLEQKTKSELDKKTENINLTADTLDDMEALITKGSITDGQICYCKEDKKLYVLKDGVWEEVGGSKSVPPTLWLIDPQTEEVRTTITEEEYNNLKNGLYNQVVYNTNDDFFSMYSPSKLFGFGEEYSFVQFKTVVNADETFSYSSMVINLITIGEKNASNEYPITIENSLTINPPSSGINKLDIEFTMNGTTTLTSEQVSLIKSYDKQYVYVKFNEGLQGDNVYIGYVFIIQDVGIFISIVSQPNISGNIVISSLIAIQDQEHETTAIHKESTIVLSRTNDGKFLKTNSEGNPEWASISIPTITFED